MFWPEEPDAMVIERKRIVSDHPYGFVDIVLALAGGILLSLYI